MLLLVSCSTIPLLKESSNSFTLVRKESLLRQLDGQLLWLGDLMPYMNCYIRFISRFSMHIHNMKIISEMDNKFFGLKRN